MLFQYNGGSSPLHRLGPLSKLIWVGCFSLLSMAWDSTLREAALLAVLIAVAGLGARLTLARQLRAMSFLIGLGIPYFILSILAIREGHTVASWGPIVITAEGLDIAGALTLRIFVLFLASYIYLSTTDPPRFCAGIESALACSLSVCVRYFSGTDVSPLIGRRRANNYGSTACSWTGTTTRVGQSVIMVERVCGCRVGECCKTGSADGAGYGGQRFRRLCRTDISSYTEQWACRQLMCCDCCINYGCFMVELIK